MIEKIPDFNVISGHELLQINPADALSIGVKDNDAVKVFSRRGELELRSKITDMVPKGVVYTTFHFPETSANVLTNSAYDPLGKVPELKFCAVNINKI